MYECNILSTFPVFETIMKGNSYMSWIMHEDCPLDSAIEMQRLGSLLQDIWKV